MFNKIFEYAGPYKSGVFKAAGTLMVSVLISIAPFILAYQMIAALIAGHSLNTGYLLVRVGGVLVCLVLQAVLYGLGLVISHETAYAILMRLRISLQQKMEGLPLGIIEDQGTGVLKKLFVDDIDSLELLLAHTLPEGFANLVTPVIVCLSMFFIDWKLALLSLASLPLGMASVMIMFSVGTKQMDTYYLAGRKMNNTIIEYINGMEVVKVFNKGSDSYQRFQNDVTGYRDFTLSWFKSCWPWMAIYNSILPCTILLTLPVGSWFVLKGYSALPDLILTLCLSLSIGIPVIKAIGFIPALPQLNYKITALEEILSAGPLHQTDTPFTGRDYTVSFDRVTFAYGDENVVRNVSLTAGPGQKTALVGESGSGKSTLAKLLIHYYDTQEGEITIGGQPIREMSLETLNRQISYVAQDQYLFNTTLLENIRIGRPDASDAEVLEAAEKAQCMEFINTLPEGVLTLAGDAGKRLSGGQRQRIALARAILKDAPIVVLDEATAYADPENEEKMEAAISELVRNKTLFVIAHKLPSIMNADQICVMSHGSLAGAGKHEELLLTCPEYQKLWNASVGSAEWKVTSGKGEQDYAPTV